MMRVTLKLGMVLLLFLVACSSTLEKTVEQTDLVDLFLAVDPTATYAETIFSGDEATGIEDLVESECPEGIEGDFARIVYAGVGNKLILYTSTDGSEVYCSIFRPEPMKDVVRASPDDAPSEDVVMTVNGEPILRESVNQALAALPAGTPQSEQSFAQVLNRVINDELLRQEATLVTVNEDEVSAARNALLSRLGADEESLQGLLEENGFTMEAFERDVLAQARLTKLLNERLLIDAIAVTNESAREYYLANTNLFVQSEQAVMRHIAVFSEDRSQDEVNERVALIARLVQTDDFCALVREYSDDRDRVDDCGTYIVPRGVLDQNLEYASFSTPVNQTSVITTDNSVHFVQTLEIVPARVVPFAQVVDGLRLDLVNAIFQQRLNLLTQVLRADAEIIVYLG